MGSLKLCLLIILLLRPAAVLAAAEPRWQAYVSEASERFGIPEAWIARVMRAESGGRLLLDGRPITSPAGAMGLMQLMPGTWADMRSAYRLGRDPYDPHDNVLAGAAYLKLLHDRFGYPGLFGAYHAGPGRYAEHLATGRPLPTKTVAYVAGLTDGERRVPPAPHPRPLPTLFAIVAEATPGAAPAPAAVGTAANAAADGLFVGIDRPR